MILSHQAPTETFKGSWCLIEMLLKNVYICCSVFSNCQFFAGQIMVVHQIIWWILPRRMAWRVFCFFVGQHITSFSDIIPGSNDNVNKSLLLACNSCDVVAFSANGILYYFSPCFFSKWRLTLYSLNMATDSLNTSTMLYYSVSTYLFTSFQ